MLYWQWKAAARKSHSKRPSGSCCHICWAGGRDENPQRWRTDWAYQQEKEEGRSKHMMAYSQGFSSHLAMMNQWLVIGKSPPHRKDKLCSAERRVGKECVSKCSSRWSLLH